MKVHRDQTIYIDKDFLKNCVKHGWFLGVLCPFGGIDNQCKHILDS